MAEQVTSDQHCCGCADDEAHKCAECFCLCHTRDDQSEVEARYQRIMADWAVGRLAPR